MQNEQSGLLRGLYVNELKLSQDQKANENPIEKEVVDDVMDQAKQEKITDEVDPQQFNPVLIKSQQLLEQQNKPLPI